MEYVQDALVWHTAHCQADSRPMRCGQCQSLADARCMLHLVSATVYADCLVCLGAKKPASASCQCYCSIHRAAHLVSSCQLLQFVVLALLCSQQGRCSLLSGCLLLLHVAGCQVCTLSFLFARPVSPHLAELQQRLLICLLLHLSAGG